MKKSKRKISRMCFKGWEENEPRSMSKVGKYFEVS
jgi:hypothetical protein